MTDIAEQQPTAVSTGASLSADQREILRARLVDDHAQTRAFIAQLESDLDSIRSSRQDVPTDDEHDPEGPTLAFERSQSTAVLENTKVHFADIESAVERLDENSYGLCARCGEPIPFARLEARPYSRHCVECAERVAH
jgi:RNA polymerase-binding transcription factor DksA